MFPSPAFPGERENCPTETVSLNILPCWTGVRSHSLLLLQCSENRRIKTFYFLQTW